MTFIMATSGFKPTEIQNWRFFLHIFFFFEWKILDEILRFRYLLISDLFFFQVSWVRRLGGELHLITFGQHTYSSDARFSLDFESPNNWRLRLSSAGEGDSGMYECQVSTHPPIVRTIYFFVSGEYRLLLTVVEIFSPKLYSQIL